MFQSAGSMSAGASRALDLAMLGKPPAKETLGDAMKPNIEPAPGGPLCKYEHIAAEIEHVAEMVLKTPELNHHAAERLLKIAQDIRSDIDRLGKAPH
jgi:hypothetical protein